MKPSPPAYNFSRLAGACLGAMCGDALGMPWEGWTAREIARRGGLHHEMQPGRLPAGSYTDDSQMMLAIMETLAQRGRLDPEHLAGRFLARYDPARGYGRRIAGVMERLAGGAAWDQAGTDSFGNGGAMRVGVLGAFYAEQESELLRAALDQCRITHFHPQGLAGAAAQALAVGLACRLGAVGISPAPPKFARYLAEAVRPIDNHTAGRLERLVGLPQGDPDAAAGFLLAEYACDVTAAEAAPPAVGAFLAASNAEQAIILAVGLGGDADTIGCMAGALSGAYWGVEALPARWLEALENGPQGRDWAMSLCTQAIQAKNELTK